MCARGARVLIRRFASTAIELPATGRRGRAGRDIRARGRRGFRRARLVGGVHGEFGETALRLILLCRNGRRKTHLLTDSDHLMSERVRITSMNATDACPIRLPPTPPSLCLPRSGTDERRQLNV